MQKVTNTTKSVFRIQKVNGEEVVDSRLIANELSIHHSNFIKLLDEHKSNVEKHFGVLAFETLKPKKGTKGGRPVRVAYLNEDQALFAGTLSRNSTPVVGFKAKLVKSYQQYRKNKATKVTMTPLETAKHLVAALEEKEALKLENGRQSERLQLQETVIAEQTPKVVYHDKVLSSTSTYKTTHIAKELKMSGVALNKKLHELKVQYKVDKTWVLYAKYQNKDYTKTETHTHINSAGEERTTMLTVWTEKGRKLIHDLVKK